MFSVVIPGRPCLTDITAVDARPGAQPTKFAFTFPATPKFNHIVVFFLPGTVLPPDTAAAIYLQTPHSKITVNGPEFQFLGAIGNEKPSAIFKVGSGSQPANTGVAQDDEMLDDGAGSVRDVTNGQVTLGISIEPAQNVAAQMAALSASRGQPQVSAALVRVPPPQKQITTKVLAQRVIGNAFNFLASFAESDPNRKGEPVVPLKSFRDWWTKFERRIDMDPTFLEREDPSQS
jgi:protein Hikeshi